jgi:hypothetical protein
MLQSVLLTTVSFCPSLSSKHFKFFFPRPQTIVTFLLLIYWLIVRPSFTGWLVGWLVYSRCSHLEHRASVKRFVSLQFLNLKHSVGLLGRVISPSQGLYLTQTDIHASSGIGTHDPSVRSSDDSSWPRPRGNCDWPVLRHNPEFVFSRGPCL